MDIVTGPDQEVLRTKASAVQNFDKKLVKLVKDMEVTVKEANGIGIAAPQVGVSKRVMLVQMNKRFVVMVNPEITSFSAETDVREEGCLSLPNVWGNVRRSTSVVVEFFNVSGKKMKLELHNMDARITQHELDHLNGILFIDKLEEGPAPQEHEPSHIA